MKKLLSSSEAAYHLGLSLQGVHYRIKKGQLESVKKDGKTYVYVETQNLKDTQQTKKESPSLQVDELVKVKDEQITFLKKSIKFLKKQHEKEITRLEKNQDKILNVFQSEVDLLKSAFNEMKKIYNLEHKKVEDTANRNSKPQDSGFGGFMDIKEFYLFMKEHKKSNSQIKNIILQKVKEGDKRFVYNKNNKELLIYKSDFLDLI